MVATMLAASATPALATRQVVGKKALSGAAGMGMLQTVLVIIIVKVR